MLKVELNKSIVAEWVRAMFNWLWDKSYHVFDWYWGWETEHTSRTGVKTCVMAWCLKKNFDTFYFKKGSQISYIWENKSIKKIFSKFLSEPNMRKIKQFPFIPKLMWILLMSSNFFTDLFLNVWDKEKGKSGGH